VKDFISLEVTLKSLLINEEKKLNKVDTKKIKGKSLVVGEGNNHWRIK